MFVRHCPRCGSDYRPGVEACADCGGPLEDRVEAADPVHAAPPAPAAPTSTALPPGDPAVLFFGDTASDVEPLAARLTSVGIPFRIDTIPMGHRQRYQIAVRDQDRDRAREQVVTLLGGTDHAQALDTGFDPDLGYHNCPACSTPLSPGQPTCPDCGLSLSD